MVINYYLYFIKFVLYRKIFQLKFVMRSVFCIYKTCTLSHFLRNLTFKVRVIVD